MNPRKTKLATRRARMLRWLHPHKGCNSTRVSLIRVTEPSGEKPKILQFLNIKSEIAKNINNTY